MHDCAKVDAQLARLVRENEALRAQSVELDRLKARVAELTTRPQPDRDPPTWAKPKNHKARPKTPGAREGHPPHHRASRPPDEEKQATLTHYPDCGSRLGDPVEACERTTEDLVAAFLKTTRWIVARYWCSRCRKKVEAEPRAPVPRHMVRSRLDAGGPRPAGG